jgi:hypothetical protein
LWKETKDVVDNQDCGFRVLVSCGICLHAFNGHVLALLFVAICDYRLEAMGKSISKGLRQYKYGTLEVADVLAQCNTRATEWTLLRISLLECIPWVGMQNRGFVSRLMTLLEWKMLESAVASRCVKK